MKKEIKRIDIKEFREKGFLQEVNRLFFHPLGLALEVIIDDNGEEKLGGVWDYRDDPEGMFYGVDNISVKKEKINYVEKLRKSKLKNRKNVKDVSVDNNGIQIFK